MRRFLIVLPLFVALACDSGKKDSDKDVAAKGGEAAKGGDAGKAGTPAAPAKNTPPDAWASWNACGVGTMVEFEMETSGMKIKTVKTLDKKGDPHTLKTETIMTVAGNESKTPGEEPVAKPKDGAADGICPLCKKAYKDHKDESKWSDETLKVGGKDVKAMKWEPAAKQCDGSDNPSKGTSIWYSTEVPGGMVKMETPQMKMTMMKFEKK
ncbi:MAG: hypothetical protein K8T20_07705 [Planctomycetes bacterium]|nr:hypothetical protein [Planctomycetota bacterium]